MRISKDKIVKASVLILLPIVLSLIIFYLYREYFFDSTFINKTVLKKDMQFKYFTYDEFDSSASVQDIASGVSTYRRSGKQYITDSGKNNMDGDVIRMFDEARDIVEKEYNSIGGNQIYFKVNSGYRTDSRNVEVGGKLNSAHRNKEGSKSKAGDISYSSYSQTERNIIEEALRRVGFTRIGKYSTFIHADNDLSLPNPANW